MGNEWGGKENNHTTRVGLFYNIFKGGFPIICKKCGILGYAKSDRAGMLARNHLANSIWFGK